MAIRGHPWLSEAISGHQWPSVAISGHQRPISGRPWPSVAQSARHLGEGEATWLGQLSGATARATAGRLPKHALELSLFRKDLM